ncbi:ParB N-terminal domain-containing protein [Methylobacterium haplocladii]|uniref:ParB-like N-terminal domain-containing protein n=1 Tax=Methylobacterium haplocladii TaxID=1176176 RepID=A0A512IS31_9HYPH|nr:ParB/RepB/Spo0J family partition protein [Methylobacterium haplocladii]GEP00520.1 hypothetical protein MHA02_29070 [Methylobacterium haplocladii]GJD85435.1 hypothetical protein HPGCJGGD_3324 [Methylobacterium haplocladii]GLS57820.1 hypothetical protein GCM10007887_04760 [Methylobacterium haplocladii]
MSLKVQEWAIDRLVEYARNPRKNDDVVDEMCAAIREFGFRIPIVAKSDGTVIDGHLRLKAARKLGLPKVSVAIADDLSEAQVKAFRLLANKSANWAKWDNELLKIEFQELQAMDFDLGLTGFDVGEISVVLDPDEAAPDDGIEDPPDDKYQEQFGVIVICGDEVEQKAMFERLQGEGLTVKVVTT